MKKEGLLRFLFILIGASLVILITVFDRQMSPHPALVIYYLIPVSLVTWFSGPVAGLCLALLSVWGWFNNGMFHIRSLFHYEFFFYLHVTFRILFLLAAVYVMNRLKKSLKKEKELSERKTYFVARVSHELNNPLTIIRGSLEFVLNGLAGGINPQQKEILASGKTAVLRLIRLVKNLLDISKIEAGKVELERKEIDIASLIKETIKDYKGEFSKKRLFLETSIPDDIGLLWGDRDKIEQVMINLLSNAAKYTQAGGLVLVRLSGSDNEVRFEISDTGPGIAKEDIPRVFDKFERLVADREDGAGLGLSIVKDIVELHRGKIWIESKVGKGTTFIFVLPRDLRK